MDKAREQTDRQLEKMEERITDIYQKSAHDISKKWDAYMERAAKRVEKHEKDLRDAQKVGDEEIISKMEKRLLDAKKSVTLSDKYYREMLDAVTDQLANVNQTALDYINGEMPKVYSWNYNQSKELADNVGVKFNLINEDTVRTLIQSGEDHMDTLRKKLNKPKDKKWNAKQINSTLLQGIIQGESIPKISRKIFHSLMGNGPGTGKDIIKKNRQAAIRNARTMITGAENRGRNDSYKQLEEDGLVMTKIWMATPDGRTRDWHIDMDGVEVGIHETFDTLYSNLEYPGDPGGDPADVYNCRCSMVTDVKGFRNADGSIREIAVHDADTEHEDAIAKEQDRRGIKSNTRTPQQNSTADISKLDTNEKILDFAKGIIRTLKIDADDIDITIKGTINNGECTIKQDRAIKNTCLYSGYNLKPNDKRPIEYRVKTAYHEAFHLALHGKSWDAITPSYKLSAPWTNIEETLTESAAIYRMESEHGLTGFIPSYPDKLVYNLPRIKQLTEYKECKTVSDFGKVAWNNRVDNYDGKSGSWKSTSSQMKKQKIEDGYYKNYTGYIKDNAETIIDKMIEAKVVPDGFKESALKDLRTAIDRIDNGVKYEIIGLNEKIVLDNAIAHTMCVKGVY